MRKTTSWFKLSVLLVVAMFAIGMIGADLAYARGGGGGGGGRSSSSFGGGRSSSSSHSSGSSKSGGGFFGGGSKSTPAAKPAAPAKTAPAFGSGSKSNAQTAPAAKTAPAFGGGKTQTKPTEATAPAAKATAPANKPTQTALQAKQSAKVSKAESKKALDTMKQEKSKFKSASSASTTPAATKNAVLGKVNGSGGNTYTTKNSYYVQRDRYYGGWNRPAYMYSYPSSFGMWDAMFLWMMLDTIGDANRNNAAMYYNHQNDPSMQEWRANAEKEAATNADMKAKLAALDAKVKEMEAKGVARDESYIPPDAGAAVLATEVAEQNLPPEPESSGHPVIWFFVIVGAFVVGIYFFVGRKKSF